jgi:hypothetical protein
VSGDLSDIVVVGARVTFMVAQDTATGQFKQLGEFPHCAHWSLIDGADQCEAEMSLTNEAAGDSFGEQCTREVGHHGPHVVHAEPGLPVLAWLIDLSAALGGGDHAE